MAIDLSMPILVVDDYSTMIRIICNLLKQLGYQNIDNANDGATALAKMRAKRYGLVISDWNMEPMSGYDLLKEVRADAALADPGVRQRLAKLAIEVPPPERLGPQPLAAYQKAEIEKWWPIVKAAGI